jgi:hypothetical protein
MRFFDYRQSAKRSARPIYGRRDEVWLHCAACGTQEQISTKDKLVGCNRCGAPRHATNGHDEPLVLWSDGAIGDHDSYEPVGED